MLQLVYPLAHVAVGGDDLVRIQHVAQSAVIVVVTVVVGIVFGSWFWFALLLELGRRLVLGRQAISQ